MQEPLDNWTEQMLKLSKSDKMTDKQMKIIEAAVEVFAKKGYAGSSTSEIAQKAGVAEGTIFRHYKTKKDLLLSIVGPLMLNTFGPLIMKDFVKVIKAPYDTFEDFLRAAMRDRLSFVRNNFPLFKILIQEIPFHDEMRNIFKDNVSKYVFPHLTEVIEHYQQEGKVATMPVATIIRFIISSFFGLMMTLLFIAPESNWNEDKEIEYTVQMIMNGLRN